MVRAEIVCDGYHVHPVVARTAIAALGRTAPWRLPTAPAARACPSATQVPLGSHTITVGREAAFLDDGTLAGSTLTMDGALEDGWWAIIGCVAGGRRARMCATTPAAQLGLTDRGRLAAGQRADLAVLDHGPARQSDRMWPASPGNRA